MEDSLADSERLIPFSILKAEEQAFEEQEKDEEEKQAKEAEEVGEAEDDTKKRGHSSSAGLTDHPASGLMVSIPGLSPRETEDHKKEDGALAGEGLTDQLLTNSKQDEPSLSADEVSLLISIIED